MGTTMRPKIVVEPVPDEDRPEFQFTPYNDIYVAVMERRQTVFISTEGWSKREEDNLLTAVYNFTNRHGQKAAIRKSARHQQSGVYIWIKDDAT